MIFQFQYQTNKVDRMELLLFNYKRGITFTLVRHWFSIFKEQGPSESNNRERGCIKKMNHNGERTKDKSINK